MTMTMAFESATMATERLAVIHGDGDELGSACEEYVPGAWDAVWSSASGVFKQMRRCRDCQRAEEDHEEPADSKRLTLIPDEPALSGERPLGDRLETERARDTVQALMGGPPDTYLYRVRRQAVLTLGREPNQWEARALRAYVAAVAASMLAEVVP